MSVELGRTIKDRLQQRDAVHVAIAPVVAFETLFPGQHIGLVDSKEGDAQWAGRAEKLIGVVDPFLPARVERGEVFWMFLYPETITSLRHDWTHPAFEVTRDSIPAVDPEGEAKRFIEDVARRCGVTYDRMMDIGRAYVEYGDYFYNGENENYKDVSSEEWEQFWKCFEKLTKAEGVDTKAYAPFSCSC